MSKASVLVIYTGGTIGMIESTDSGALKPFDFTHIFEEVPELRKINCELSSYSFDHPIDSSNMHPGIWSELVKLIRDHYEEFDGFVILHGSDTMAFTASALSYMLENLTKPVILTGSQLPIGTLRTDGKENLITAIEIASARNHGMPVINEVAIYFEYKLYRGNRTRKIDAEDFEAFQSLNYPPLAEAGVHIKYNNVLLKRPASRTLIAHEAMNPNVGILKLFPGITKNMVNAILDTPGLEGLVLETYGSGNAPTQDWFIEALGRAIDRGIILLNVSQCNGGAVQQGKYETSKRLQEVGVIGAADMTTEAAVTKLMFLLGQQLNKSALRKALTKNLRGEMS